MASIFKTNNGLLEFIIYLGLSMSSVLNFMKKISWKIFPDAGWKM